MLRKPGRVIYLLLAALLTLVTGPAIAETERVVVIKEAPPFAFKQADGRWSGPAVTLWEHAAEALGVEFTYRELTLTQMLDAVERGEADLALGALSVTAARERRFDFTHPFHTTGFGIATREVSGSALTSIVSRLLSAQFLTAAGSLLGLLLVTGFLVVLLERRRNAEQFGGNWLQSLGSGFWWSAVTMTTVGYGDKAPRTALGRLIAVIWMFAAVIIISGFTASIASSLTLEHLTAVTGEDDLRRARVGTVADSSSEEYLRSERIAPLTLGTLEEALARLQAGQLDAVVYDLPLIAWQLERNPQWDAVSVLPGTLTTQQYAIAVPSGSMLREQLNRIIPEYTATEAWRLQVQAY